MKNLEQQFSEDLFITQSSNSSVRENSDDPIPVDLLTDILSRLPTKSIGRFLCVSKLWESILGGPDFTELFVTKSCPRIFFAIEVNEEIFVFSSPQPQHPNDNSWLVATRYKSFPTYFPKGTFGICNTVCGLVFLQSWIRKKVRFICNPTTGEYITLPKVKTTGIGNSYLGFDPISKKFKVLCMTWSRYGTPNTHRVLTLGTGKRIWRTIEDPVVRHNYSYCRGICINGVLYYTASFPSFPKYSRKIVCFDFRFEKFSFINLDEDMKNGSQLTLFNYKGKLGALSYIRESWGPLELAFWVLQEDAIWSKHILPNTVKNSYKFLGMTDTGEIVFSPYELSNPFYILYYNMETGDFTRVYIQGFEEFLRFEWFQNHPSIHTSLDFVERVKFM